jgi:hypothetical protein
MVRLWFVREKMWFVGKGSFITSIKKKALWKGEREVESTLGLLHLPKKSDQ